MKSVLQDWVMELPLREQGTLLTAVRGCDLTPKPLNPAELTSARQLVAFLRYCFMNPADPREVDIPGAFFQSNIPEKWKASEFGHLPLHWYTHVMHAYEIVAYRSPDHRCASLAHLVYQQMVRCLHLNPESEDEMIRRLSEDRIATGEVVS